MSPKKSIKKVAVRAVKDESNDGSIDETVEEPVDETSEEPLEEMTAPPPINASLRLYRRIAVGFVLLVAIVLGIVLYVSTVQATIRISPVTQTLSAEVLLDVVPTPTRENEIRGTLVSGKLNRTETFQPSGEGAKEVEGTARGTVTIYNTSTSAQALVATTRLLSPDGILFRIDSAVNVPAGGSAEVAVHADLPGKTGDIGPTRFTIPGLSAALQELIYAESTKAFTGGFAKVAVISQGDIDRAAADLKAKLEEDGKAMLRQEVGEGLAGESFTSEVLEMTTSVVAGSEAASFDVSLTVQVIGVFFDRDAAGVIALRELYEKLGPGREFVDVNEDGLQATVEKYDVVTKAVNVRVYVDGLAAVSTTSASLDPARFVGKTEEEVREMLVAEGIAKDVEIEFVPSWAKRVPTLKDHILIERE